MLFRGAMQIALSAAAVSAPLALPLTGSPVFDEAELLVGLRAGDNSSYELLVERYGGRLLAVARRLLRGDDEAEDVVQEAFVCAFRSLERFRGGSQLGTWLHRVTVNAALMRMRRRTSRSEVPLDDALPVVDAAAPTRPLFAGRGIDAEQELLREETRHRVRQCIDRLPDAYRTVLILRDIEELDTREAASLLGITPNAVKIRLHRARQALTTLLFEPRPCRATAATRAQPREDSSSRRRSATRRTKRAGKSTSSAETRRAARAARTPNR